MYIELCQINLFCLFRTIHGYIRIKYNDRSASGVRKEGGRKSEVLNEEQKGE